MNIERASSIARTLIAAHGYDLKYRDDADWEYWGFCTTRMYHTVYIKAHLTELEQALTLVHEAVHVLQCRHFPYIPACQTTERDAIVVQENFRRAIEGHAARVPWPDYWPYKYRV